MATTTANKAGLRAGAAERTRKHAQRTPLPPRAGQVQDAKEVIAEAHEERIRVAQARKLAKRQAEDAAEVRDEFCGNRNVAPCKSTPECSYHYAPPVVAEPKRAPRKAKPAETEAVAATGDTKSAAKAAAFILVLKEAGWTGTVEHDGEYTEVVAERGTEVMHQAWLNGVYHNDTATYTIGDRTVRTRNVAEARKWAARTAEEAEGIAHKAQTNVHFRKKAPELPVAKLPFDAALSTDTEVVDALLGKRVAWINAISREEETCQVHPSGKWARVQEYHGARVFLFLSVGHGFRAFRLTDLRRVGGSLRKVAQTAEAA